MDIRRLAKEGYLKAEPRSHGGSTNVLDFSANINPFGASKRVYKAIRDNLHLITRYPDPNATALKDAISDYLSIDKDNIIIGNGSNEIIHSFANIFIDKGDKVIIPEPTFYEYEFASDKNSAMIEFIDIDELSSIEFDNTKVLFICNPNNPTGQLYDHALIKKIVDEAYNRSVLVMIDECFIEFIDKPSEHSLVNYVDEYNNLIILRSFTKAFGLAGLRIGYAITSKELARIMNKSSVTWNTNALAQIAAIEALNDLEHIEKSRRIIKKERMYMKQKIEELYYVYDSDVNFFLIRCNDSIVLRNKLLKHGILVRDCSNFTNMSNDHIRVAVRNRSDNKRLIETLEMVND